MDSNDHVRDAALNKLKWNADREHDEIAELTKSQWEILQKEREELINLVEGSLLGTASRRGIWTDRDYLVHALAILTDTDRARVAALHKPFVIDDRNRILHHEDEPWWEQYEKTANELDAWNNHDTSLGLSLAANDIRTLVSGLRDLERKLGETDGPDPTLTGQD